MDNNNNPWESKSWESGIKFVEEKKSRKFIKFLGLLLIIFFSASFGGILGGYYVKNNYLASNYDQLMTKENQNKNVTTSLPTSIIAKNSITKVAETVGPAVVGIENNVQTWGGGMTPMGSGSGIIFDKAGYIVTNQHVIEGASKVVVTLPGGERKVTARIIGSDMKTDLAVLKIEAQNLPVAKLGDSSQVKVGEVAVAIGNPMGQEYAGSVTAGIVSAMNRNLSVDGRKYKVIQTDASINEGNSGGALCNEAGEVIGINSLKLGNSEGIGFAISINEAKPIIESLMKKGYVSRPYLGIGYVFIDSDTSQLYHTPVGAGVKQVMPGTAAEAAGLQAGDVITAIDGKELKNQNDLGDIIEGHKVGDTAKVKVWRGGKYLETQVKLGDSKGQ